MTLSSPDHHVLHGRETDISWYDWGPKDAPPVLLLHATGFHARVWDKTIAEIGVPARVIAVDTRGHGLSGDRGPIKVWSEAAGDIAELIEHLNLSGMIGVGHSMGGHMITQLAAKMPERFRELILVDPVIGAPAFYEESPHTVFSSVKDHPIARRRNKWVNWQELYHRLEGQYPYSVWVPEILEDYCRYGLHPAKDGEMELACAPELEASIYMTFASMKILEIVPQVPHPVTILRAKGREPGAEQVIDFSLSPTWDRLAEHFPNGTDVYLPDLTHFIPMQDPALVAHYIREALER